MQTKENTHIPLKKKQWTKKDYSNYFKSSKELSDYTVNKKGLIKSRYSK